MLMTCNKLDLEKALVVTTAHVTKETAQKLNQIAAVNATIAIDLETVPEIVAIKENMDPWQTEMPIVAGFQYGWIVSTYLPEDKSSEDTGRPKDLEAVLEYARQNDINLVLFDRDADPVEDLKLYDW